MKKEIIKCTVCNHSDLESVIELPNLPLTGIYLEPNETDNYPKFDQALMLCNNCGHMQLRNMIDPKYVYQDTYTHRSGESPISKSGNDFFLNYLHKNHTEKIASIFEIGCNDIYLLSQLKNDAKELTGVDPIWENKVFKKENITVIGDFVENIDFSTTFDVKPTLVISSHTFEHIENVQEILKTILHNVEEGTHFLIEIPCADTLLKLCRFDQVFHQHFQYFSLHSFFNFIQLHDCEFLDYTMNYDYWGGTMLFSFKKGGNSHKENPFKKFSKKDVQTRFYIFKAELDHLTNITTHIDEEIYGFGAAQMLPILIYHMSDASFFKAIIDDNPARCGKKLVDLNIPIIPSSSVENISDSVIVITALDSTKPILSRLEKIKPRYIIKPIQIF